MMAFDMNKLAMRFLDLAVNVAQIRIRLAANNRLRWMRALSVTSGNAMKGYFSHILKSRLLLLYVGLIAVLPAVAYSKPRSTSGVISRSVMEVGGTLSKEDRNAKYATEKLLLAKLELDKVNLGKARLLLNSAKLYLSRVATHDFRMDELRKQLAAAEARYQRVRSASLHETERTRHINKQKNAFRSYVSSHSGLFHALLVGKENRTGVSPKKLNYLADHQMELNDLAKNFSPQFSLLMDQSPEFEYSHLSVAKVHDLLGHWTQYFNQLVYQTSRQVLDTLQTDLHNALNTLVSSGRIDSSWLDGLYGQQSYKSFEQLMLIQSWYAQTGMQPPVSQLEHIQALKTRLKETLESSGRRRDRGKRVVVKANVLGLLQNAGSKQGLSVVEAWMIEPQTRAIKKTHHGYPLHKATRGCALFRRGNEPFFRQYDFEATRIFNGVGYEAISTVKLHSDVTIINSRIN